MSSLAAAFITHPVSLPLTLSSAAVTAYLFNLQFPRKTEQIPYYSDVLFAIILGAGFSWLWSFRHMLRPAHVMCALLLITSSMTTLTQRHLRKSGSVAAMRSPKDAAGKARVVGITLSSCATCSSIVFIIARDLLSGWR
jgi:hypothetical protein